MDPSKNLSRLVERLEGTKVKVSGIAVEFFPSEVGSLSLCAIDTSKYSSVVSGVSCQQLRLVGDGSTTPKVSELRVVGRGDLRGVRSQGTGTGCQLSWRPSILPGPTMPPGTVTYCDPPNSSYLVGTVSTMLGCKGRTRIYGVCQGRS